MPPGSPPAVSLVWAMAGTPRSPSSPAPPHLVSLDEDRRRKASIEREVRGLSEEQLKGGAVVRAAVNEPVL